MKELCPAIHKSRVYVIGANLQFPKLHEGGRQIESIRWYWPLHFLWWSGCNRGAM
ncbi:hypothetical protein CLOSTMETH_03481 [[Clostridium] methylpentosum DSM 5476]|uniref:Uncharacterized protein n=1 Tax=[Clostridium] methylpentosum DSM 5476 TaxID=537013 RepID=C0EHY6_9FIRM|nr:hypothetical protein CLOSTMETH_03481 [[Clostridium] methylpentosum DSM 5476]